MTKAVDTRRMNVKDTYEVEERSEKFFWGVFGKSIEFSTHIEEMPKLPETIQALQAHRVSHTGVILDITSSPVLLTRLNAILDTTIANLGFNLVQLPLAGDHGFVTKLHNLPPFVEAMVMHASKAIMDPTKLKEFVNSCRAKGVKVMPEISVSTRATGWHGSGYVTECPEHM